MRNEILATLTVFTLATIAGTQEAKAHAQGVGLGVAGGGVFSPSTVESGDPKDAKIDVGNGFAWGFFVDIPLLETFYISPAAMLYELDLGSGRKPVTDVAGLGAQLLVQAHPHQRRG